MTAQRESLITATLKAMNTDDTFLRTYGNLALAVEQAHLAAMREHVRGSAIYYSLLTTSNGGVARVLTNPCRFQVTNTNNHFDCDMTAEGSSLATFILAINHLAWDEHAKGNDSGLGFLVGQQELLTDYLYEGHPEGPTILHFLD